MFKRWNMFFALLCFNNVLKSRNESEITSGKPFNQTSCSTGWFSYGDMCYKMGEGILSWEQASEQCRLDYNGSLVAIHSKGLADFVTAFFLLRVRQTMWIGLHDRVREGAYIWDDGSPMDFNNWARGEPSFMRSIREKEDCAVLFFHNAHFSIRMGKWVGAKCNLQLPFICQKERGNFNSEYLDPRFCSSELGGGWKHLTSCFHFVNESKTWLRAEEHCVENFKGHLVTILDWAMELYLDYILGDEEKNTWIGIRNKNGNVQQWSSGWYVAYENWPLHEIGVFGEGTCVVRIKNEAWYNLSCNAVLPFVCEYSTSVPPSLKPTIEGATCPESPNDWKDLGGDYCYFFETVYDFNWYQANFLCMKRGGSLITIHSLDELKILHNFIRFKQNVIYIGLNRQKMDIRFAWADGSPLTFTNWDVNQPNSSWEACVEMRTSNLKWDDVSCKKSRGYICSIPKVLPNQTHEQQDASSLCLNGYSSTTLVGVIFCVVFVAALIVVIMHYYSFFYRKYERVHKIIPAQFQSASYRKPKDRSELIVVEDA